MTQERVSEMIHDLDSLNDRLSDLALDLLHRAMGDPDPKLSAAAKSEKIVTRSRRSVEKARSLLNSLDLDQEE
jgi:hypothetical protein